MSPWVYLWMMRAVWRQQPGALIAAIVSIALGVALGLGIDLVNRSALNEFDDALDTINGRAQYRLTTARGVLDEQWLDRLESETLVRAASPVIETDLLVTAVDDAPLAREGRNGVRVQLVAMDVFRAAAVAPALLPQSDHRDDAGASSRLFADDSIFLSAAARRVLGLADAGASRATRLTANINGQPKSLRISGSVPGATGGAPIAVMDIGAAQWQLDWLGKLSRIDLRLTDGVDAAQLLDALGRDGTDTAMLQLLRPEQQARQMSNLSLAYRVNLNVLALVALLTGGFIVYASMELAVLRMTPAMALIGVLGAPPAAIPRLAMLITLSLGILGAIAGVGLGLGLAWLILGLIGGDLGGGYFSATRPALVAPAHALALFCALGVLAALGGGLSPALRLRKLAPAQALKTGLPGQAANRAAPLRRAGLLAIAGAILLTLPAIARLPIGAYAAIACWLFAGVLLVGPILGWITGRLSSEYGQLDTPLIWLAIARLKNAYQSAFPALAGVVASFALVCAMGVMVHSFRVSVDQWLLQVLPADIYLRVSGTSVAGGLSGPEQSALARIAGVDQVGFLRAIELSLKPDEPAVVLLARPVNPSDPGRSLPLTGDWLKPQARTSDCIAVYPSEPAAALYNWQLGSRIKLPVDAGQADRCFEVTGIWRDYARQHGAITIDRNDYRMITGDDSVSDAALTLDRNASADQVLTRAREVLKERPDLQIRSAAEIRSVSLKIFDRSFAVTYALEAVALLVALFGVATTYSGEALSREREFGMLRHLGLTRASLARLFAAESFIAIGLGLVWGCALGALIAQILIHWVNPQSFNWTMQTHWPVGLIGAGALGLLTLGVFSAILAARRAAGQAPIAAVRADW